MLKSTSFQFQTVRKKLLMTGVQLIYRATFKDNKVIPKPPKSYSDLNVKGPHNNHAFSSFFHKKKTYNFNSKNIISSIKKTKNEIKNAFSRNDKSNKEIDISSPLNTMTIKEMRNLKYKIPKNKIKSTKKELKEIIKNLSRHPEEQDDDIHHNIDGFIRLQKALQEDRAEKNEEIDDQLSTSILQKPISPYKALQPIPEIFGSTYPNKALDQIYKLMSFDPKKSQSYSSIIKRSWWKQNPLLDLSLCAELEEPLDLSNCTYLKEVIYSDAVTNIDSKLLPPNCIVIHKNYSDAGKLVKILKQLPKNQRIKNEYIRFFKKALNEKTSDLDLSTLTELRIPLDLSKWKHLKKVTYNYPITQVDPAFIPAGCTVECKPDLTTISIDTSALYEDKTIRRYSSDSFDSNTNTLTPFAYQYAASSASTIIPSSPTTSFFERDMESGLGSEMRSRSPSIASSTDSHSTLIADANSLTSSTTILKHHENPLPDLPQLLKGIVHHSNAPLSLTGMQASTSFTIEILRLLSSISEETDTSEMVLTQNKQNLFDLDQKPLPPLPMHSLEEPKSENRSNQSATAILGDNKKFPFFNKYFGQKSDEQGTQA